MKTIFWIAAIIAVLGLGFYFVKSASAPTNAAGTATDAQSASATRSPDASASPAPDFSLEKLGGGTITLSDYKGKKPVILGFWTTWCPNCRRDMPHQNEWYQKYKDKIEVIGINMQEEPSVVKAFIAQLGITYPIALDPNAAATRAYGVSYTNYHVLIDKNGNIVKTIPGDVSEQDFLSLINS